ncbi:MAG: hypothetical protein KKF50_01260 [Nanoarchaeota archaeon]|nr:hypothetical protein [Nanoarchaeota archaeon]
MKRGMIISCPDYDDVTKAFLDFSQEIKDLAKHKSLLLKELNGENANAIEFGKVLSKLDYSFVCINGHGDEKSVAGNKSEIILSEEINLKEYGKRICYCRSCESGKILGAKLTENGGSFIGYSQPFEFYIDEKNIANPLRDRTASLFLSPSNIIPMTLIKGKTVNEANERGKMAILKSIKKVINEENADLMIAVALWKNYNSQIVHGKKDITISSEF